MSQLPSRVSINIENTYTVIKRGNSTSEDSPRPREKSNPTEKSIAIELHTFQTGKIYSLSIRSSRVEYALGYYWDYLVFTVNFMAFTRYTRVCRYHPLYQQYTSLKINLYFPKQTYIWLKLAFCNTSQ